MLPAAKNKVNYKKVGEKLGHSPELVKKVNDAVYSFIREKIVNLPLSEIVCEEDFNKLRTAFTLPKLGILYAPYIHVKYLNYYVRVNNKTITPDVLGIDHYYEQVQRTGVHPGYIYNRSREIQSSVEGISDSSGCGRSSENSESGGCGLCEPKEI